MFEFECWHDDYGNKWIPKRYIAETASKAKYQHANYLYNELNRGDSVFELLKDMKIRKIGTASICYFFGDSDTFERVKAARGIEFAYQGMQIDVCGKSGVIVGGNHCLNLDVVFNFGSPKCYKDNCHPWYETVYYDNKGDILADYREIKKDLI